MPFPHRKEWGSVSDWGGNKIIISKKKSKNYLNRNPFNQTESYRLIKVRKIKDFGMIRQMPRFKITGAERYKSFSSSNIITFIPRKDSLPRKMLELVLCKSRSACDLI